VNDLVPEPPKGVHTALYADDIALWCTAEYATTANYRVQIALDKVVTWAGKWRVKKQLELSSHSLQKSNLPD
jgi:hypothetical protein